MFPFDNVITVRIKTGLLSVGLPWNFNRNANILTPIHQYTNCQRHHLTRYCRMLCQMDTVATSHRGLSFEMRWPTSVISTVGLLVAWHRDQEFSSILMELHVAEGDDTRLLKTTSQLYGPPHAKAKTKSCLIRKIMKLFNTDDNYKWAHKLWLDDFPTNHMQDRVHWLWIRDGELRTRLCLGGNNNWLAIRHAFKT